MADDCALDPHAAFQPRVLRDYAFLGDGERGALVGPAGELAWMCAPTWDSDAVFATLIGGAGSYAVTQAGRYTWGGYYDRRSLIWTWRMPQDSPALLRQRPGPPNHHDRLVITSADWLLGGCPISAEADPARLGGGERDGE